MFVKGAIVLMRDMRRKKRKGGKLDPKWLGPYTIIQQLGKGFYSLQSLATPTSFVKRVNGSKLKLCYKFPSSNLTSNNDASSSSAYSKSGIHTSDQQYQTFTESPVLKQTFLVNSDVHRANVSSYQH